MAKTKPTYADSLKKITDADNAVKQALARKRELIEQSKLIAYDEIAQLYGAEGQALIDAVRSQSWRTKVLLIMMPTEMLQQTDSSHSMMRRRIPMRIEIYPTTKRTDSRLSSVLCRSNDPATKCRCDQ